MDQQQPTSAPLVSVVMPVYNGSRYLREAIDSVLEQTLADFELLIIDDGSTDGSPELVRCYTDPRIRLLENDRNRGVAFTRNVGIDAARGLFLAWLDCDDTMLPDRLEKQYRYLNEHPAIGACGTQLERFGNAGTERSRALSDPKELKALLLFTPAIPNATVMLRLEMVREQGLRYDSELPVAEDYDFILSCSRYFPMTVLPEVLYRYRAAENSLTERYDADEERAFQTTKIVHARALAQLRIEATDEQLRIHRILNSDQLFTSPGQYHAAFSWLLYLMQRNDEVGFYDRAVFRRILANRFYFISKKASRFGFSTLGFFLRKGLQNQLRYLVPTDLAKLGVRCLIKYDKF